MAFSEEYIRSKLGDVNCPQGQCIRVEKEIREKLIGNEAALNHTCCKDLDTAIKLINDSINEDSSFVTTWISTGSDDKGNPVNHFLIINNSNPLQSFSVWPSDGICFNDENSTKKFISDTLSSEAHGNQLDIHVYKNTQRAA